MATQNIESPYTNSTKLHVSQLQIGMHVSDLDRDWLETPFLLQSFIIETLEDIDKLAIYCDHVWVDTQAASRSQLTLHSTISPSTKPQVTIHKVSSPALIAKYNKIYEESHSAVSAIMGDIRLGSALDTKQAKKTVKACVESIITDPDTMLLLSKLRERDCYTTEHSMNVCVLSIAFGRALEFNPLELNNLGICGLLHDVGKMKIPAEVLNKVDPLTDKEWKMLQAHPVHGRNILLKASSIYHGAVDVAYSHHERIDGKGYPRQIASAGISQYSKIIAICDAYDAMTAQRCYKKAVASTKALKILYDNRGTQFDENLVDRFMSMIGVYPPGSVVELKNGSVGIVISRNLKYQHLPKVLLVRDESQNVCSEKVINLADIEKGRLADGFLIKCDLVDGSYDITLKDFVEKGLKIAV